MDAVWQISLGLVGLLATVVFGIQNDLKGRYERVLSALDHLMAGSVSTCRHRLGEFDFDRARVPQGSERASLRQDFFAVDGAFRRLDATLSSVTSRVPGLKGPERLLARTTLRTVTYFAGAVPRVAERLDLETVDYVQASIADLADRIRQVPGAHE